MQRYLSYILLLTTLSFGISGAVYAQQSIGYYESEVILSKIPEYEGIQQRLNLLSSGWQEEIDQLEAEIQALEEDFEAKEILYTDEQREQRLQEIRNLKQQKNNFLAQKFGPNGEYFTRQKELLEPIQRQVFSAVRTVAQRKGLDFVFDRSSDISIVYAREEWNINNDVLLELGIEIDEN